jgi:hypothetical protein
MSAMRLPVNIQKKPAHVETGRQTGRQAAVIRKPAPAPATPPARATAAAEQRVAERDDRSSYSIVPAVAVLDETAASRLLDPLMESLPVSYPTGPLMLL